VLVVTKIVNMRYKNKQNQLTETTVENHLPDF
jgi:hypothetical protein